jgi:hypothetical protein
MLTDGPSLKSYFNIYTHMHNQNGTYEVLKEPRPFYRAFVSLNKYFKDDIETFNTNVTCVTRGGSSIGLGNRGRQEALTSLFNSPPLNPKSVHEFKYRTF